MDRKPLTVIETTSFLRQAEKVWSEEERSAFVDFIARNPETGDVIPDTGGVRKVRWGRAGSGKRGGARVIYFYYHEETPLYLLLAYAKADREDMSVEGKRSARAFVATIKREQPSEGGKS